MTKNSIHFFSVKHEEKARNVFHTCKIFRQVYKWLICKAIKSRVNVRHFKDISNVGQNITLHLAKKLVWLHTSNEIQISSSCSQFYNESKLWTNLFWSVRISLGHTKWRTFPKLFKVSSWVQDGRQNLSSVCLFNHQYHKRLLNNLSICYFTMSVFCSWFFCFLLFFSKSAFLRYKKANL